MWKANYTGYTKRSAGIAHIAEGNFFRSGLAFYTNGSTSSTGDWAERMRIGMEGNVGIGTDNPLAKVAILTSGTFVLNSNGNDYSGVNIQMKTTNTAVNAIGSGIVWNKGASTRKVAAITNYIYGDADQSGLNFYVQPTSSGSSAVLTEAMRITNTGGISFGSTGTAYGGIGQVLTSAGNASPTWTTPTTGTVTGTGVTGEVAYWTSSTNIANNAGMSFSNEQLQLDGIGGADGFALPYDENPGYSNMSAGGFGILFREARDNYILGNAYWYKTGGTASWRAKYGAHAATMIGSDGGNITFETAPVNTTSPHTLTFSPKMVIKNGGYVGIGTISPTTPLSIESSGSDEFIKIENTATYTGLWMNDSGTNNGWLVLSGYTDAVSLGDFAIREYGVQTSLTIKQTTGNVGIGTTSPTQKLVVTGNIGTSGSVLFDDNQGINFGNSNAKIIGTSADGIKFFGTGSEKMRLTQAGNFGIGTTNPASKLHVVSTTNDNATYNTVKISHSRSDTDVGTNALYIDMNLSGADATTADRQNRGIFVDIDSTADGDATNEHRIRGVNSDVRFSGFSDIVQSGYFYAESNNNTVKTAQLIGVYGNSVHDSSTTSGGVSNMYGVYGLADIQDLGDVDNAFGGFFQVNIGGSRGNANIGITKGVEGQVNIDKATTIDYGTMMAVSAIIDNNEGAVPNFGNQFLFRGDYQGDRGSDAYGIYCEGDKHYLEGKLAINLATPTQALHVAGNARVTGAYYDSNNSPGAANQVLVSTVTGTDWIDGSAIPGVPAGSGTLNTVAMWTPDGDTLGDGPITFSGNNSTFSGAITIGAHLILQQDGTNDLIKSTGNVLYHKANEYSFQDNSSNSWVTIKSGKVGIGVTGPSYPLDVNGIIRSENSSEVGTLYLGNTAQSQIPGGAIIGQRSPNYSSTGNLLFQVPTWGANTDYGLTTQMSIEVSTSDTKEATISMIPFGGDVLITAALLSNQENTDVDTGTETVASVAIATYTAAFFDFVIKKTTNVRSGTVYACHDGTNVEFTETSTQDLGDTSDVTLSVDISGGNMRLRATTTSDDWIIKSLIRAI